MGLRVLGLGLGREQSSFLLRQSVKSLVGLQWHHYSESKQAQE